MARVLCLHGLGGTGATMWPVVAAMSDAGHTALAPTLPGHGTRPEDLREVGWEHWVDAALDWPADVVVGQSMGAALALELAARGSCRAVVAVNPVPPDADAVEGLEWRQSRGHDMVEAPPLHEGESGYTRLPVAALLEMARGVLATDLGAVTAPVLIVSSALDEVVDPASADVVAAALGSRPYRLTLPGSGHVATLGPDRATLLKAVTAFVATAI